MSVAETPEQLQYEITALENLLNERKEQEEKHGRRVDLMRGVILGLLYGIIGNLLVQHWYGVFEGLSSYNFDSLFTENLAVFVFALAIILYTTYDFYKYIKKETKEEKIARVDAEVFRKALLRRKQQLENSNR